MFNLKITLTIKLLEKLDRFTSKSTVNSSTLQNTNLRYKLEFNLRVTFHLK